ncbi:MAG: hypothetical protein JWM21_4621 [Acidobacteria bacterium]|nr:hypothetical protein [Acidobacteriota bacterium]
MRRNLRISSLRIKENSEKAIKVYADYQIDWPEVVPALRRCELEKVSFLSVMGDAPKDFTTDHEYRYGHRSRRQRRESYIAKVGSKFYPNESITEQLITRIGQTYRLRIADSKLRLIDGQVRFMSKYFLRRHSEQLTHGAEIFERCLGKEEYLELAEKKIEREYFSFQMTCEAIRNAFPDHETPIVRGFVEMLAFDALIGHNDRHPYNWGVIVPMRKDRSPRFSPVYDTARALFWNSSEEYVGRVLRDKRPLLEGYIGKCNPPLGWDGEPRVDFFRLIGLIWKGFEGYRQNIEKFLRNDALEKSILIVDKEFRLLMSANRLELIKRCLRLRQQLLCSAIKNFKEGEDMKDAN